MSSMDPYAIFQKAVQDTEKTQVTDNLRTAIAQLGYDIVEANEGKPWGVYYRLDAAQIAQFLEDFFPGLSLTEAKLGNNEAELSPKFLVVAPGQRLSWQYHGRRAERWTFLTDGLYHRSIDDELGEPVSATAGEVVQFQTGERHRLCAMADSWTVVAEIWQHTDLAQLSDENDIVRLADDYSR